MSFIDTFLVPFALAIISSMLIDNVVLSRFYGICPFLGVSKKPQSALGMGVAVVFVIVLVHGEATNAFFLDGHAETLDKNKLFEKYYPGRDASDATIKRAVLITVSGWCDPEFN